MFYIAIECDPGHGNSIGLIRSGQGCGKLLSRIIGPFLRVVAQNEGTAFEFCWEHDNYGAEHVLASRSIFVSLKKGPGSYKIGSSIGNEDISMENVP